MGCFGSKFIEDQLDHDTRAGEFVFCTPASQQASVKRGHLSRGYLSGTSSSGVWSRSTTPTRTISKMSSCTTSPTSSKQQSLKARRNILKAHKYDVDDIQKALDRITVCDDFDDGPERKQEEYHAENLPNSNESFGYCTASSRGSASSTPERFNLKFTQDTSDSADVDTPSSATGNGLEMEMFMMTSLPGFMPKTSSPLSRRRDVTFDVCEEEAPPPSPAYQKWSNYLQNTPAYMLHNVSRIPEAVAGHFSPLDFPVYSDLRFVEMASTPKRRSVDTHLYVNEEVLRAARKLISTEL